MSAGLAAALLSNLGFQPVGNNSLMASLDSISPDGGTAMRDSLLTGIGMILNLNAALMQIGRADDWHFMHILITDGQDTSSSASLEDAAERMQAVGEHVPVRRCKTEIIGIDLEESLDSSSELMYLKRKGGENCDLHDINSIDISDLFSRIQMEIGVIRRTQVGIVQSYTGQHAMMVAQSSQPVARISKVSFAIVFNIDISGSMSGRRYELVKRSVREFLRECPDDDLVAGICFNDSPTLLKPMQISQYSSRRALMPPARQTPQTGTEEKKPCCVCCSFCERCSLFY